MHDPKWVPARRFRISQMAQAAGRPTSVPVWASAQQIMFYIQNNLINTNTVSLEWDENKSRCFFHIYYLDGKNDSELEKNIQDMFARYYLKRRGNRYDGKVLISTFELDGATLNDSLHPSNTTLLIAFVVVLSLVVYVGILIGQEMMQNEIVCEYFLYVYDNTIKSYADPWLEFYRGKGLMRL